MITFFRRFFESKIGLVVSLAFIGLIAIAFAGADMTGTSFGGVAGGNVAKVGDISIGTGEFREEIQRAYEAERQQNPALDYDTFISTGGFDRVLKSMVDSAALDAYARDLGFGTTKALEDAEIRKIPIFQGVNGEFDQSVFELALRNIEMSESQLRQDIRRQLLIRQLMAPVSDIRSTSQGISLPYASLLLEARSGKASFLASAAYAPQGDVSAEDVSKFYRANTARYQIPERRVIRYAEFGLSSLGDAGQVTDQEIATYYESNKADYAARETRSISQVIAGDRAVADRIAAAAKAGGTLQDAASANGLSASQSDVNSQTELAGNIGADAARAVYAVSAGQVAGPVQGTLGWVVTKVQSVEGQPARSLASVRSDIAAQLQERKQQEALIDLYNGFQDALASGADIAELAETRGLTVRTTPAILSNGTQPESDMPEIDPVFVPVLAIAFQATEENIGEIATLENNRRFALVDVNRIVQAAPPPLRDIQQRVERDYRLSEGAKRAKTIARAVAARVEKGATLEAAIAAENVPSFVTQEIGGKRADLARAQGGIPPELSLLFSMAPQSVKTLEMASDAGWMVIYLDKIDEGDATKEEGLVEAVASQLAQSLGNEYASGILAAARKAVGVEINEDTVNALKRELTGGQ